jgi:biopolymer transport protein ExbD
MDLGIWLAEHLEIERLDTTVYAPRVDKRIIVAVALVAACGKNKQQCQADVADLVDYMKSMNVEEAKVGPSTAHLLVRTDGTKKPAQTAVMADVFPDRVLVDGQVVSEAAFGDKLVEIKNRRSESGRMKPDEDGNMVLLAIDEATPFAKVAALVESATAAGHDHIGLVYAAPFDAKPPPRTSVEADFEKAGTDPSERAMVLAKSLKGIVEKCKPMQKMFGDLASFESGNKNDMFVAGTGEALLQCECNVDFPKLRSAAYILLGQAPLRAIYFIADKTQGALELPGATPWKDAGKQVTAQTRWLIAK